MTECRRLPMRLAGRGFTPFVIERISVGTLGRVEIGGATGRSSRATPGLGARAYLALGRPRGASALLDTVAAHCKAAPPPREGSGEPLTKALARARAEVRRYEEAHPSGRPPMKRSALARQREEAKAHALLLRREALSPHAAAAKKPGTWHTWLPSFMQHRATAACSLSAH